MVVSLKEVVEALEMVDAEVDCHLNPETGEIFSMGPDDRGLAEHEGDGSDLPAWQREDLPRVREIYETDRWKKLPTKHDIHEWSIMERFCRRQGEASGALLDAIHGAGAFRMFKSTIRRLKLEDEWHRFREAAFEQIARDWLESHGIPHE